MKLIENLLKELESLRKQAHALSNPFSLSLKEVNELELRNNPSLNSFKCDACNTLVSEHYINAYGFCAECWNELSRPRQRMIKQSGECGHDQFLSRLN